jgi:hypothetical protein
MPLRPLTALLLFLPLFCFAQSGSIADQLAAGKRATDAGKWDLAIESYRQARSAAQAVGDAKSESAALTGMGETEFGRSHIDLAEKLGRESLKLAEKSGDGPSIVAALRQIGSVLYLRAQFKDVEQTQRVLAIQTELGNRKGVAAALNNIGNARRSMGDPDRYRLPFAR